MARTYLGLGANLGDRTRTLRSVVAMLTRYGTLTGVSSLYETEPVGYQDQPAFSNAVVALDTGQAPASLLAAALTIEQALGRIRSFPNAPRTCDIDILLYDDLVRDSPPPIIPHPRLHERAFVLVPLAELAPTLRHPRLGASIAELLTRLGDTSQAVRRIAGPDWVGRG